MKLIENINKSEKIAEKKSFIEISVKALTTPGFEIRGSPKFKYIEIEDASYWELLDNAWGLVILSFELVIYRVCRLINTTVKRKKVDPVKEEQRSDILSILNDMDRLGKGAYCTQLSSVRHYFKQRMPEHSVRVEAG